MPIEIDVIEPYSAPNTGWTGFKTPHSSNVGQTYGPAGMGIGAYMNRPESQPGFKPFTIPRPGYDSAVGTSMQTDGPAGMGMRPYVNRPETQPGFKPFTPPSEFNRMRGYGITDPNLGGAKVWNADWRESGPAEWLGKKTFPFIHKYFGNPLDKLLGYDETSSEFANPYLDDQGPPVDNEGNLLPGWELHQDGWHYFPPEFEDENNPVYDPNNPNHFMMPEDFPKDFPFDPNAPTFEARSRYKSEYDKAIRQLLNKGMKIKDAIIELAPQWGSQPYKGFNYKMANRGGLMSLV